MREVIEAMQQRMRETGEAVAYCTGGHGHTFVSVGECIKREDGSYADAHGGCPGPIIVMELNPHVEALVVEGGTRREPPPCGRCMDTTEVSVRDGDLFVGLPVAKEDAGEVQTFELSFTLQDAIDGGIEPMGVSGQPLTICLRCLAAALMSGQTFALLELNGRTVPWRR